MPSSGMDLRVSRGDLLLFSDRNFLTHPGVPVETTEGLLWDAGGHMGRVKSLRNGSGAAATAARAGAAVWACRPAAGEESAAALEQQRAMAAIRAIFRVWGCATSVVSSCPPISSRLATAEG